MLTVLPPKMRRLVWYVNTAISGLHAVSNLMYNSRRVRTKSEINSLSTPVPAQMTLPVYVEASISEMAYEIAVSQDVVLRMCKFSRF